MNSEGKPDSAASLSDGADGVSKKEGIEEPDVGVAPLDANEDPNARSGGKHDRNGSMTEAFLAAPGHSASFASLGDTNAFDSHHKPKYSDTFEGFKTPSLSASHEVQETPKVTRPEGLSFTTPVSGSKSPGNGESPEPGFSTPFSIIDEEGEKQDYTSPIANLVEKPRGDSASPGTPIERVHARGNGDAFSFGGVSEAPETRGVQPANPVNTPALPSPSTPAEQVPALGSVGSFAFGGAHEKPNESDVLSKNIAGDGVHPSPSTPPELVPALGNSNSFSFSEIHGIHAPQTTNEPHVIKRKIPGHELLGSFMKTSLPASLQTQGNLQGMNGISSPVIGSSSSGEVPNVQETLGEEKSVVRQPKPHDTDIVHQSDEAPRPEELAVASPPAEKLENRAVDSPIVDSADTPTTQDSVDPSNVATAGEGVREGVVVKTVEDATDTADEKEPSNALPQSQISSTPETFALPNVNPQTEVSTSANTATPKPGPFLGTLKTMSTKKWRGPNDDDLKTMVVIPKYLSRNMAKAVSTKGVANPEGPVEGERIEAPTCPILVFINSKSGGRLGPELMDHFEELLSPEQVYDLSKHSPAAVLEYGVGCLDRMADSDECARLTRQNLRIIVAGGDGTVGWVLSSLGALRELSATHSVPPVGVIPLGTGNDLSRSFGWGGTFSSTSKKSLKRCLVKALGAKAVPLDTWNAVVMPAKSIASEGIQFPHAMKPQQHVPLPSSVAGDRHEKDEAAPAFEGLFFNYFSVGMDAQVAYGFHHLRDEKPWLARGRTANQMIYSTFGCTQGWFCTACSMAPRARGVSNILKLLVRKKGNASKDWEEIHIPSNVRAVVICNLKSYAGGRNPWGKPSSSTRQKGGLEEQNPDDGLLEVMGLKDGWHSAFVMLEVSTAVRLCQAESVKLELTGRARRKAYLQMDGEPWMQPMGAPTDEPTVVLIEKLSAPSMLLKR